MLSNNKLDTEISKQFLESLNNSEFKTADNILAENPALAEKKHFMNKILLRAALYGNGKVIEYILSKGADINAQDSEGNTPFHLALSRGHEEAVRLLGNSNKINLFILNNKNQSVVVVINPQIKNLCFRQIAESYALTMLLRGNIAGLRDFLSCHQQVLPWIKLRKKHIFIGVNRLIMNDCVNLLRSLHESLGINSMEISDDNNNRITVNSFLVNDSAKTALFLLTEPADRNNLLKMAIQANKPKIILACLQNNVYFDEQEALFGLAVKNGWEEIEKEILTEMETATSNNKRTREEMEAADVLYKMENAVNTNNQNNNEPVATTNTSGLFAKRQAIATDQHDGPVTSHTA